MTELPPLDHKENLSKSSLIIISLTRRPRNDQRQRYLSDTSADGWGDGVALLVERRTQDSMTPVTRGSNPSAAQEQFVSFSESKMLC